MYFLNIYVIPFILIPFMFVLLKLLISRFNTTGICGVGDLPANSRSDEGGDQLQTVQYPYLTICVDLVTCDYFKLFCVHLFY